MDSNNESPALLIREQTWPIFWIPFGALAGFLCLVGPLLAFVCVGKNITPWEFFQAWFLTLESPCYSSLLSSTMLSLLLYGLVFCFWDFTKRVLMPTGIKFGNQLVEWHEITKLEACPPYWNSAKIYTASASYTLINNRHLLLNKQLFWKTLQEYGGHRSVIKDFIDQYAECSR